MYLFQLVIKNLRLCLVLLMDLRQPELFFVNIRLNVISIFVLGYISIFITALVDFDLCI
jgi:hypothetical protein